MTVCWYPDQKTEATLDTPCSTDGSTGACCGRDSICLSNGLCLSTTQPYTLSRGSCTDVYWGSACPSVCR
ncbi:hypothetical protein BDV59DRAFT_189233, partial [Aspergillus ambiguus]|uniref:uncharacterized protein n=1 Tax=Aspergillus ambiguus TaxID=176160 RepID=UPI003CCCE616